MDDAEAEKIRSGFIYKIRALLPRRGIIEGIWGLLALFVISLLSLIAFPMTSPVSGLPINPPRFLFYVPMGLFLVMAVLIGLNLLSNNNPLEPLADSKDFEDLNKLADKNTEVESFVMEAINNDRTFRRRDLDAAKKIYGDHQSKMGALRNQQEVKIAQSKFIANFQKQRQ